MENPDEDHYFPGKENEGEYRQHQLLGIASVVITVREAEGLDRVPFL